MSKKIIITITLLSLLSCKQEKNNGTVYQPHFQEPFLNVALDSTSTWQQIIDAADLFADSLFILAEDTINGNYRLAAQEWGYMTIYVLSDIYDKKKEQGLNVSFNDIRPVIDRLNDAASIWIKTWDEENIYIWRDHFFNCHQQSKKPVPGYFNFMIVVPKADSKNTTMRITFPLAANKDFPPLLAFKNYENGTLNEKDDYEDAVQLVDEIKVHTDTNEMYADVDEEVVRMMLQYDVLYLMFQSTSTDDGAPEEIEIARVSLAPLQQKIEKIKQ